MQYGHALAATPTVPEHEYNGSSLACPLAVPPKPCGSPVRVHRLRYCLNAQGNTHAEEAQGGGLPPGLPEGGQAELWAKD